MTTPVPGLADGGVVRGRDPEFDRATHGLSPLSAEQEAAMVSGARYLDGLDERGRMDLEREHWRGDADWCCRQIAVARRRLANPLTRHDATFFPQHIAALQARLALAEEREMAAIVALRELDWSIAA